MKPASKYDVVIIGAGAAGLTAAIGLARAGFRVAVLEAGPYPGAENWSGCVYFCENLARPEILGPDGVEALAWERRLVQRGLFATDGHGLLGFTYRDPQAFRYCYTVLRPVYDHHLAQVARRWGVLLLPRTTALSLIRDNGRVLGIITQRGPLYADLVFLAEGDAAHLVTREGYLPQTEVRPTGRFFQGIKLVLELPPGAIEERFGLGEEEGAAYEFVLRNGTLDGRPLHLNLGGFLYTNRQSLSLGLVVPVEHLHEHFGGDPYVLLDWFASLPALAPWLSGARRSTFGAKLIHHSGRQELPRLVDNGLAIGGAASGLGVDFPYPNFTGPATAMGWQLVQAACHIRAAGAAFDRDALEQYYLQPLQRSHYWQDFEFLRGWPGYLHKTRVFFDQHLDLLLGSAYLWTRSDRWFLSRWWSWLRLCRQLAGSARWPELRADLHQLHKALPLNRVLPRPALGQLLLDGALNACRDWMRKPRAHLPPAGQLRLHYQVGGGREPAGLPPASWRRWFARFAPVLACVARLIYSNEAVPVESKLRRALQLLWQQINVVDVFVFLFFALFSSILGLFQALTERLWRRRQTTEELTRPDLVRDYLAATRHAIDLTARLPAARQTWDAQLARLRYETVKSSHIHVLWPQQLAEKDAVAQAGLWHVCPAHVYDYRRSADGQVQIIVNFENCIKCETCWRASELVDWGRDGAQRFAYAVFSPQVVRLLTDQEETSLVCPLSPQQRDWWSSLLPVKPVQEATPVLAPAEAAFLSEVHYLLNTLNHKLDELAEALAAEPRTVDRARSEFFILLARYVHQLALRVRDLMREGPWPTGAGPDADVVHERALQLARALAAKAEEQVRHAWEQRLTWAVSDGWHLRYHHLTGLRRCLEWFCPVAALPAYQPATLQWQHAERQLVETAHKAASWCQQLDVLFPPGSWRLHESGTPLSPAQDQLLRHLLAQVPKVDEKDIDNNLYSPFRKWLLAELGRRDPSLAYRAASHLWARDLAHLAPESSEITEAARRWTTGDRWACLACVADDGASWLVPAGFAEMDLLLCRGEYLRLIRERPPQLQVEPLTSLGLRGAGLCKLQVEATLWQEATRIPADRMERRIACLRAADLMALAFGMSDRLCQRAVEHAGQRVQFPGLFLDEEGRDTIGKFGAVKKLLADLAARRLMLETLVQLPGTAISSATGVPHIVLLSALGMELLGTAPGSVTYNAGQIFGGTGYSEDDILSKYYRDSSTLRFIGESPVAVFLAQGRQLLADWDGQGHQLSNWPQEAQLFEEVVQRKALQAELDEIRVQRARLRRLVGEWRSRMPAGAEVAGAELAESLGRLDAWLLASKALLLRIHARLEAGLPSEVEVALLRVWLEGLADRLDDLEDLVHRQQASELQRVARPLADPTSGPSISCYADFLASRQTYNSGDFLCHLTEVQLPRYVPEMVDSDPELAARQREIRDLFQAQFGSPRDGLSYERWIEKQHRPADTDLEFLRQHGYFRFPIPRELGGEGRRKAEYYLLTTTAQRLADVAISLTIQVNSSLGTTPILLARDKDLPQAQQEIGGFAADLATQDDIRQRLRKLQGSWETTPHRLLLTSVQEMQTRLDELFRRRPVLRSLAGSFLSHWQKVRQAAERSQAGDTALAPALTAWENLCQEAASLVDELGRRRQACDLFLRWIAAGQISAFALTEPSAGSDTARLMTRAHPRSVPVEMEPDGALRFIPFGQKEPRYLLDASRLEFRLTMLQGRPQLRAFYRWSDQAEPALIHFDEYDYETDRGQRYYEHGARRIYFTDIAQLRSRQGQLWYDYWELTGSKMWITNGRICGVLCLYARTAAGITGFLVDRHAEGLVVGKDEAKMGQCGSPTNELSLQAVRVPRENVLGLEGRGQANALETLNAGRVGLAMSAMCQMRWLLESCRRQVQRLATGGSASCEISSARPPSWATWRLQRLEEDCFLAEALAYDLVGRFEHPGTRSLRLESASGKLLNSELWLRMLETAEELFGPEGQTTHQLLEKRKRDARVLTIYEGTNEVQRFLILRELVNEVAPRLTASKAPAGYSSYFSSEIVETDALKEQLRQQLQAACQTFGTQLWQNPNLQANCFLLAEATAWLAAAESTLGRLAWLSRRLPHAEDSDLPVDLNCGWRAWKRCTQEVNRRLRRFAEELTHLRRGFYSPAIRAATLLLRARTAPLPPAIPDSHLTRPFSILVVLDAPLAQLPEIHTADGRLLEHDRQWSDSEQAALEMALRLRESATAPCHLEVVCVGPRRALPLLREIAALGVDRVCLLVPPEGETASADQAAAALRTLWPETPCFDLVLGGSGPGEEGLTAPLLAATWGISYVGTAQALIVHTEDEESLQLWPSPQEQKYRLPAAVTLESGLSLRPFTLAGYLSGLEQRLEVHSWPVSLPATPLFLEAVAATPAQSSGEPPPTPLSPWQAAQLVMEILNISKPFAPPPSPHATTTTRKLRWERTRQPLFLEATGACWVLAVLAAEAGGDLSPQAECVLRAAGLLAQSAGAARVGTLVLTGPTEEERQRTAAALAALTSVPSVLVPTPLPAAGSRDALSTPAGRAALLHALWPQLETTPLAVVAESWAEPAFLALGGSTLPAGRLLLRVAELERHQKQLFVETARSRGRLRCRQLLTLQPGTTCWLTLAQDGQVGAVTLPEGETIRIQVLEVDWTPLLSQPPLRQLLSRARRTPSRPTRLAEADCIIDLGAGIGNRDGYEAVIVPLEKTLRQLGVERLALGGSRKVTEELHLLPTECQIGQSGVAVQPKVLLAIGLSGAPQHVNYIGLETIIIAFNRDAEAPLVTLNQRQARPRVYPVLGDLFETVPAFTAALCQSRPAEPNWPHSEITQGV